MEVAIPPNAQAEVHVPSDTHDSVVVGPKEAARYVRPTGVHNGRAVFAVQSGEYSFEVSRTADINQG
jgi:hypothetical protein